MPKNNLNDPRRAHWEEYVSLQMDEEYTVDVYLERFAKAGDFSLIFVTGHGLTANIGPISAKNLRRMLSFLEDSLDRELKTED